MLMTFCAYVLWIRTDRLKLYKYSKSQNTVHYRKTTKFQAKLFRYNALTKIEHKTKFSIYRKPIMIDTVIPELSNQSTRIKHSVLNSYIHRLLTVPLSKVNFEK